jgi:cobalt/nickel transport system permease protein
MVVNLNNNHDNVDNRRIEPSGFAFLDPRSKILLACGFILTVSLLPSGEFVLYAFLLLILYAFAFLSDISPALVIRRSFIAIPFALAAITLLITVPGKTLVTFPILGLDISVEGTVRFFSVVTKSWISVQAAILLVALTDFSDLIWGLQALRVPAILISIANFSYRYLEVLRGETARLRTAREARSAVQPGGKPGGGVLWRARVTGWMVGSLMIRSMERSERVYNAMLARGYSGEVKTLKHFQLVTLDYWSLVLAGLFFTTVILAALFF